MESKKSDSADLTTKSGYFFSIGLALSLLLVLTAFEWSTIDGAFAVTSDRIGDNFEPLLEIPHTDIPPMPIPKVNEIIIKVVPDDVPTEDSIQIIDIDPNVNSPIQNVLVPMPEPEIEEDLTFLIVEESAAPKGGMQAFYKFVGEKIKYPAQARRMGIEGRVFVEFVINKDGTLSDVRAIKGIGAGCDEEAVRIVQSVPAWNPGKQRGKAVKQRYTLPIIFKLG